MVLPFYLSLSTWYVSQKEDVRTKIVSDDINNALTALDTLITDRQAYVNNFPTQAERDAEAERQAELEHAKRHITQGIQLTHNADSVVQQKERVLRILDALGTI